ncbi:radical SAM family heme chaperone HemW [Caproicibacterium sp. NSD3]
MNGLYLHVPFCVQKCPYCDFFSLRATEEQMESYTDFLILTMKKWKKEHPDFFCDTLYFGGGTPSLLGAKRLCRLTNAARTEFGLTDAEITVEVNPGEISPDFFPPLFEAGVNRISLGLQSANPEELSFLGRRHTPQQAAAAMAEARRAGIQNISLDLILAFPGQTDDSLKESIQFCRENGASHVSAYLLQIEPGTLFFKNRNSLNLPGEEETCERYLFACQELKGAGFSQYEISNFAKPGYEGRHNLKYWNQEEYLGLGPSASSYYNRKRFYWPRSLRGFLMGEPPLEETDRVIPAGSFAEYALLRLRLCEGLTEKGCLSRFSHGIPSSLRKAAIPYEKAGLLTQSPEALALTPHGFLVSNSLIETLLEAL